MLQSAPTQHGFELVMMSVNGVLLSVAGFFLKQTWNEIKEVKNDVKDNTGRIIRLETLNEVD